jgi:hypothetical protein
MGCCMVWMAKKPRHTVRRALSQAWVLNGHFSFPLRYKQRGVKLLTLLFGEFGWKSPFLGTNLEACPVPLPVIASGESMANVPATGVSHLSSEKAKPKPLYVCPGCSNHTYSEQYGEQI